MVNLVLHQDVLNHGLHTVGLSRSGSKLAIRSRHDDIVSALHPDQLVKLGGKNGECLVSTRKFDLSVTLLSEALLQTCFRRENRQCAPRTLLLRERDSHQVRRT